MRKKILSLLTALLVFGSVLATSVPTSAVYYSDRTTTINGYSLLDIKVLSVTLHASGYSNASSGDVTDVWMTSWCIFPNNIENEKTWTAKHPYGEYAKGSFKNVVGIPSPWGALGFGSNTQYMSMLF